MRDRRCEMRRLPFVLLTGVGLTISANIADAKLMRGPAEVGRSAAEGARELARAQRSQRNTAEARESLRGNTERYLLANPFGTAVLQPVCLRIHARFAPEAGVFKMCLALQRRSASTQERMKFRSHNSKSLHRRASCRDCGMMRTCATHTNSHSGGQSSGLSLVANSTTCCSFCCTRWRWHAYLTARSLCQGFISAKASDAHASITSRRSGTSFHQLGCQNHTDVCHRIALWSRYPSSHFINTTKLKDAGYKTIELEEFKRRWWAKQDLDADELIAASGTDGGWRAAPLKLPRVYIRGLGEQGPRLENFNEFGLQFEEYKFIEFPFAFQQQSAARWVDGSSPAHNGRYSVWQLGA